MTSRRRFLERVAVAGGFGAAYTTMRALGMTPELAYGAPLDLAGGPAGTKVVVLGAGMAGLISAWELCEAGYDVTVLEARDRVGGRNWSIRGGTKVDMIDGSQQLCNFAEGQYANMGPARLPSHHQTMLGYCRKFGIRLETEVNQSRSALMQNDGVNGGKPFRIRQAMADTHGHMSELLAKSINRGRLDDALGPEDRDRMVAFLRQYGDLDTNFLYRGSARAGYGTEPGMAGQRGIAADPISMHELLDEDLWLAILFDEFIDWQATMMQPVGGMDQIPRAFETRLGNRIRRGIEVSEIRKTPNGVAITTKDRKTGAPAQVQADYAICTLPLNILSDMPADFSPETRGALKRVRYDESLKVAFQAPRFWEQDQIYGGLSYVHGDTGVVWYPSHGFHEPSGVLLGAYASGDPARVLAAKPLAARIEAARNAVERLHPGCSQLLTDGINVTWSQIPYSLGPWVKEWGEPGGNDVRDAQILNEPDGRIYFATANLSETPGWQEGAARSAHRVVGRIADHARQSLPL